MAFQRNSTLRRCHPAERLASPFLAPPRSGVILDVGHTPPTVHIRDRMHAAFTIAFKNGILDAAALMFYPFDARDRWGALAEYATARARRCADFVDASQREEWKNVIHHPPAVDARPANKRTFDIATDFEDILALDPRSLGSEVLDYLLRCQKWNNEQIEWFYTILGRLLFPVGTDNWRIVPFLCGLPATGKSTIVRALQTMVPDDKVACRDLSANACRGKWLAVHDEVASHVSIGPAVLDTIPTFLAGVELPSGLQKSTHRVTRFEFKQCIGEHKPDLCMRLEETSSAMVFRMAVSYQQARARFGHCTRVGW